MRLRGVQARRARRREERVDASDRRRLWNGAAAAVRRPRTEAPAVRTESALQVIKDIRRLHTKTFWHIIAAVVTLRAAAALHAAPKVR